VKGCAVFGPWLLGVYPANKALEGPETEGVAERARKQGAEGMLLAGILGGAGVVRCRGDDVVVGLGCGGLRLSSAQVSSEAQVARQIPVAGERGIW
jgi:hypothetical protein